MFDEFEAQLEQWVGELDPALLAPRDAARLFEKVSRVERLVGAAKTLLAPRAAESGEWRKRGERSAAHWLARQTGTSVGQARGVLETAERVAKLPATEAALRAGELSGAQVSLVAEAAAADPASEGKLL